MIARLTAWAEAQDLGGRLALPYRTTWRAALSAAILFGWRPVWRLYRHRWIAWTMLPGDRVHDMLRRLDGEVVAVPMPGTVDVVWTPYEATKRYPHLLASLPVTDAPMLVEHPGAPGGYVVTRWRERGVPALRVVA